jgi:hypothetical protein
MKNMTQNDHVTFYIEGPDWANEVEIDTSIFDTEAAQLFEAGTKAIEKQMEKSDEVNFGAILLVKKGKKTAKEAMVNSYICLNNANQFALAEKLRATFKESTGQDLSVDEKGYSY